MDLRLALVTAVRSNDCDLHWLDDPTERLAQYGQAVQGRIKVRPRQLVAVDTAVTPPAVVWRWFRGIVILRRDRQVVVDNQVYQPGFRMAISLMWLPDILEVEVQVGDEVFYTHDPQGAVIDIVQQDQPAHPERIAADLLPAILDIYAERRERGEPLNVRP